MVKKHNSPTYLLTVPCFTIVCPRAGQTPRVSFVFIPSVDSSIRTVFIPHVLLILPIHSSRKPILLLTAFPAVPGFFHLLPEVNLALCKVFILLGNRPGRARMDRALVGYFSTRYSRSRSLYFSTRSRSLYFSTRSRSLYFSTRYSRSRS